MVLEAKKLTCKKHFNNLSFTVNEGEIVNILSADTKKSDVLLKALIGLQSYEGSIKLFEHEAKKNLTKAKEFIGYTSSLKYKVNHKVIDYLNLTSKFYKADYSDRINELCAKFMISGSKKMKELNPHEEKIVSIIKAILHNPKLVIFNNNLDSLDSKAKTALEDEIVKMKALGSSFVIASQSQALNIVDRVYILNDSLKEFSEIKSFYKISISYTNEFSSSALKVITLLNLSKNDGAISFVINSKLEDVMKYIISLKPQFVEISRPYIGEIFSESLPTVQ